MLPWRILKPIKQRVFSGSWCNNQEPGGGFEWTKTRNYLCICIICFCFPYLQRRDNLTIELSMKDREYHFCDNNDVNNYDNNDVSNDVNNDDNNTDDQKPPQQCQWTVHKQTRGWPPSKVLSWKWILITLTLREHKDKGPAFKAKTQPNTVMFNSV